MESNLSLIKLYQLISYSFVIWLVLKYKLSIETEYSSFVAD